MRVVIDEFDDIPPPPNYALSMMHIDVPTRLSVDDDGPRLRPPNREAKPIRPPGGFQPSRPSTKTASVVSGSKRPSRGARDPPSSKTVSMDDKSLLSARKSRSAPKTSTSFPRSEEKEGYIFVKMLK